MRKISVQELTREGFWRYGTYGKILNPDTPHIGEKNDPICCFYRDIMQFPASGQVSISAGIAPAGEKRITKMEYHSGAQEVTMLIDGDAVMAFASAGEEQKLPVAKVEAFYIPKGTMLVIRAGVWHFAQIPVGNAPVTALVLLPERTYANDCVLTELEAEEQIVVEL